MDVGTTVDGVRVADRSQLHPIRGFHQHVSRYPISIIRVIICIDCDIYSTQDVTVSRRSDEVAGGEPGVPVPLRAHRSASDFCVFYH